jgi:hypothetical protein
MISRPGDANVTMKKRRAAWAAVGLLSMLVLGIGACASSTPAASGGDPFSGSADRQRIEIKIVNLNFQDATVWAIAAGGRRERLGTVIGKREAVFTLPWRFTEPLRLEFDLVAGPRCVTEELTVDPGDLLELQIATEFFATPGCR